MNENTYEKRLEILDVIKENNSISLVFNQKLDEYKITLSIEDVEYLYIELEELLAENRKS